MGNDPLNMSLLYPLSWKVSFHPLSERIERRTQAWLEDVGVIHDDAGRERFRKLTVWAYAGWSFPLGDEDRMETIMAFLALWIFYDDVIEEKDDGILGKIKDAIAGRPSVFPGGGPLYRAWWELGQRYARVMSPAWLERHAERFEEWVLAVRQELDVASNYRQRGIFPAADAHRERRIISVGMIPCIDFIEYQMGWELPADILKEPEITALEWVSSEIVAITNDLFSYQKDKRQRWCNLVSCVAQEGPFPLEEAFRRTVDLHNQRGLLLSHLGAKLLLKHPKRPELVDWLQRLYYVTYGFARWHAIATRYNAEHPLEDGKILRLSVNEFDDEAAVVLRRSQAHFAQAHY
jgi:hypothetical protein